MKTNRGREAYRKYLALSPEEAVAWEAAWDARMLKEAEATNAAADAQAAAADARDAVDETALAELNAAKERLV